MIDANVGGIFVTYRKEYTEFFINFFTHQAETSDELDAQFQMNM